MNISIKKVSELYNSGLTQRQISARLKCSLKLIQKRLQMGGVDCSIGQYATRLKHKEIMNTINMLNESESITEASRKLGISYNALLYRINSREWTIRKRLAVYDKNGEIV